MKYQLKIILAIVAVSLMAFTAYKAKLTFTSSAFVENGMVPAKYSCDGLGVSPPLSVSNIPANTKMLAITLHDPDAPHPGGVTHWVAWNLPMDGNIPEGFKGGQQGQNSDHKTGYKAICPSDGKRHHYNFKVYALDTTLQLDTAATDKSALEKAMQGHIIAQGELTGLYIKSK